MKTRLFISAICLLTGVFFSACDKDDKGDVTPPVIKLTEPEETAGEPGWVYGVKYQGRFLQPGEKVPAGATLTLVVGSGQSEQTDSLQVEGEATVPFQESGNEQERVDDSWF